MSMLLIPFLFLLFDIVVAFFIEGVVEWYTPYEASWEETFLFAFWPFMLLAFIVAIPFYLVYRVGNKVGRFLEF